MNYGSNCHNHCFHLYRMCICPACLKSVQHPHSQVTHKEECDHLPPWLLVLVGVVGWKPGTENHKKAELLEITEQRIQDTKQSFLRSQSRDHKIQSRAIRDHRTEISKYKVELLEILTCRKHPGWRQSGVLPGEEWGGRPGMLEDVPLAATKIDNQLCYELETEPGRMFQ